MACLKPKKTSQKTQTPRSMNILNVQLNESHYLEDGWLLISEPFLPDPNFERCVILMCDHQEKGSFGLTLNKPTQIQLEHVTDLTSAPHRLYAGGPVAPSTLHYIHTKPEIEDSILLKDGVFLGGNYEQVSKMVQNGSLDASNSRFFTGYSGWGEDQLKTELDHNSWIISNFDISNIFQIEDHQIWQTILRKMGGKYRVLSNFPIDPTLN